MHRYRKFYVCNATLQRRTTHIFKMKVFEGTPQEFYMDGILKSNLDTAKEVIKQDWDMLFCVDGVEGSGKSTLAIQSAFYCDPSLTMERIVFTPQDFKNAILKAEPFQAVIYDEGYSGLSSRGVMSEVNKSLVAMLAEIRQKNLFVFIVMPTFFDLDRYVGIWRSRALLHVYTGDNFKRGFFSFYNSDKKKTLFQLGKKLYSYREPLPNFYGRFTGHFPLNQTQYKKKKLQSLNNRAIEIKHKQDLQELDKALFERIMQLGNDVPHSVKMKILGLKRPTYFRKIKLFKQIA